MRSGTEPGGEPHALSVTTGELMASPPKAKTGSDEKKGGPDEEWKKLLTLLPAAAQYKLASTCGIPSSMNYSSKTVADSLSQAKKERKCKR
jgi:hypothetical protein